MVEVIEFPHLGNKYQVMGVPRTVIDETIHIEGAVPEPMLMREFQKLLEVGWSNGCGDEGVRGARQCIARIALIPAVYVLEASFLTRVVALSYSCSTAWTHIATWRNLEACASELAQARPTGGCSDTTAEATKPAASKGGGLAGMVVADSSISFVDGANGILEYRGYDIRVLAETQHIRGSGLPAVERPPADRAGTGRDEAAVACVPFHAARDHRRAAQHAAQRRPDGCHAHRWPPCWPITIPSPRTTRPSAHQHKACRLLGQIVGRRCRLRAHSPRVTSRSSRAWTSTMQPTSCGC